MAIWRTVEFINTKAQLDYQRSLEGVRLYLHATDAFCARLEREALEQATPDELAACVTLVRSCEDETGAAGLQVGNADATFTIERNGKLVWQRPINSDSDTYGAVEELHRAMSIYGKP